MRIMHDKLRESIESKSSSASKKTVQFAHLIFCKPKASADKNKAFGLWLSQYSRIFPGQALYYNIWATGRNNINAPPSFLYPPPVHTWEMPSFKKKGLIAPIHLKYSSLQKSVIDVGFWAHGLSKSIFYLTLVAEAATITSHIRQSFGGTQTLSRDE